MQCKVSSCTGRVAQNSYSRLCPKHNKRKTQQGDPCQSAVTRMDIEPYVTFAHSRLTLAPYKEKTIPHVEAVFHTLHEWAAKKVAEYERGRPGIRSQIQAAQTIIALIGACPGKEDIITLASNSAAMALLRHDKPHRFASDEGYLHQLAYRFMRSNDALRVCGGTNRAGRKTSVVNRLNRKAMQHLGVNLDAVMWRWSAWNTRQWDRLQDALKLVHETYIGCSDAPIPELNELLSSIHGREVHSLDF